MCEANFTSVHIILAFCFAARGLFRSDENNETRHFVPSRHPRPWLTRLSHPLAVYPSLPFLPASSPLFSQNTICRVNNVGPRACRGHRAPFDLPSPHSRRHPRRVPSSQRVGGGARQPPSINCADYERFELCFALSDCGEERAAWEAAELYSVLHRNRPFVSHHTFLALHGMVQSQCTFGCSQRTEETCRRRLSPAVRDRDGALLLEMGGQRLQVRHTLRPRHLSLSRRDLLRNHPFHPKSLE